MKRFEPRDNDNKNQQARLNLSESNNSSVDFANKYKLALANQLESPKSKLNLKKSLE